MSIGNVPVINIAELEKPQTLQALDNACREWGFFQVVEHGIDDRIVKTLTREMRGLFAQSRTAKHAISRTAENPWGFFDRELTKNTLDWKEVYDFCAAMEPQWPAALPKFRVAMLAYYRACEALAFRLLSAISVNLGMPANHLGCDFKPAHSSFVRLNYYPVCPTPAHPRGTCTPDGGSLGVNHHTDAGALTLLLQDNQPGLEVFHGGQWHLITPRRDALVINIGDIVQVWSNDLYRAALHRVIASSAAERFSAPFFFNPAYTTNYAPLATTIDAEHPVHYQPINWGEFRARRAAGDYADCGEEIQISDYRLLSASV